MKKTTFTVMHVLIVLALATVALLGGKAVHAEKSEFNKAVILVRDKDYTSAVKIFKSLAEQDDHDAQYNLALLLRKGLGHPSNYPLALQWAWLSQLSGKAKAADLTEDLLSLIPDETQDLVRAKVRKILQQRMEKGDRDAILQKALYHLIVVVEPDYIAAYALRSLGAAIGLKGAIGLRDEIEGELEIKELMDSQARAAKIFVEYDWSAADEE